MAGLPLGVESGILKSVEGVNRAEWPSSTCLSAICNRLSVLFGRVPQTKKWAAECRPITIGVCLMVELRGIEPLTS